MRPADSALGIFRSPDADLCVPGRRILRPREPCGAQNMSKSPGQDTCRVSTSRSTMPGLVARGLTLEVI